MRALLILFLFFISCHSGKEIIHNEPETADFLIKFQTNETDAILTCEEGCNWKTLTFNLDLNGDYKTFTSTGHVNHEEYDQERFSFIALYNALMKE